MRLYIASLIAMMWVCGFVLGRGCGYRSAETDASESRLATRAYYGSLEYRAKQLVASIASYGGMLSHIEDPVTQATIANGEFGGNDISDGTCSFRMIPSGCGQGDAFFIGARDGGAYFICLPTLESIRRDAAILNDVEW